MLMGRESCEVDWSEDPEVLQIEDFEIEIEAKPRKPAPKTGPEWRRVAQQRFGHQGVNQ